MDRQQLGDIHSWRVQKAIHGLTQMVQSHREEMERTKRLWREERRSTEAKWKALTEELRSLFHPQQEQCVRRLRQLEEQLSRRDSEILLLREEMEELSHKLMDTSNQVDRLEDFLTKSKMKKKTRRKKNWFWFCDEKVEPASSQEEAELLAAERTAKTEQIFPEQNVKKDARGTETDKKLSRRRRRR